MNKKCNNCLKTISDADLCEECERVLESIEYKEYIEDNNYFYQEFCDIIKKHKEIYFAYSWWLDSTVVLYKLVKICKDYRIELKTFSINYWYKWKISIQNIDSIIDDLNIRNNHKFIDIVAAENWNYKEWYTQWIMPCGKLCNKIIDSYYKNFLDENKANLLVTGWDTPKYNSKLWRYSILWEKENFDVLRWWISFWLNKKRNDNFIKENNIPWIHPHCGWYDTDCLMPGSVMRKFVEKNKEYCIEKDFPVVIDYITERLRWKIVDREYAIKNMDKLDIADDNCFDEIEKLSKTKSE